MWQEQGREPGVASTPKRGEREEEKDLPEAQRTAHFWDLGWDSLSVSPGPGPAHIKAWPSVNLCSAKGFLST